MADLHDVTQATRGRKRSVPTTCFSIDFSAAYRAVRAVIGAADLQVLSTTVHSLTRSKILFNRFHVRVAQRYRYCTNRWKITICAVGSSS